MLCVLYVLRVCVCVSEHEGIEDMPRLTWCSSHFSCLAGGNDGLAGGNDASRVGP